MAAAFWHISLSVLSFFAVHNTEQTGARIMSDLIRIKHLCKYFGRIQAVDDLSFQVKEGELFAFLGINGAGKSTTINILCG